MVRSMTAFASQSLELKGFTLGWELRSVNHRYLDLSIKLPELFRSLEAQARSLAPAQLKRGKVECVFYCRREDAASASRRVNLSLVRQLLDSAREINVLMDEPGTFSALDLLRWPGVWEENAPDLGELGPEALALLSKAFGELLAQRRREGEKLGEMIRQRCAALAEQVARARARLPEVRQGLRARLQARLAEVTAEPDPSRFEQELVYLLHKLDVDEELDRLGAHLEEVERILEQPEAVGRRLDFLMQEMNREANTLGSKSTDSITSAISVEMKVLIEQMREQIQNIE